MSLKRVIVEYLVQRKAVRDIAIKLNNRLKGDTVGLSADSIHFNKNRIISAGKQNALSCLGNSFMQRTGICFNGNNNRISIEDKSVVYGGNTVTFNVNGNNNRILIGNNTVIKETSFFIKGNNCTISLGDHISSFGTAFHIEGDHGRIIIGDQTTFHGRTAAPVEFTVEESKTIQIGDDCMFSNGIHIRTTDSHSIVDTKGKRINPPKDVVVGNHCWIGMGSYLLKGTKLKDNTMVAAASVCTKEWNVGNCIIAGNKAEIIKRDINWRREQLV